MLQPLRSSIYAFKTDFVVAGWIARLKPNELRRGAARELASAGFPNPTIRNYDDKPLDPQALDQPIDVLMDVEPRNAETMALSRPQLDQDPVLGPMLARAHGEESRWRPTRFRCCARRADRPRSGRARSCRRARRSRRAS